MDLSPDQKILWPSGPWPANLLNSTIVTTWALMLVMVVGAKLITRKLKTEGAISRWQGLLEIVITAIQQQIKEVGLQHPAKVSQLYRHLVSVYRGVQPVRDHPLVRSADRFAIDNVGAGDLRVCRRDCLRHPGARFLGLPQILPGAHVHHAAV